MNSIAKLNSLIQEQYNLQDARKKTAIFPDELADLVYEEIDPNGKSPELVKFACLLELRQLARAICRARSCQDDPLIEQEASLFTLQDRYPAERDGKPGYVLREDLSYRERRENSARLRAEAVAKVEHANALDMETNALVRAGKLKPDDGSNPEDFNLPLN